ncbi:DNA polymerase I, partial [bacterium]
MLKRLIIIDGSSLIYRAFHAIPLTLTSPSGLVSNAVFGFTQSLKKILKDFSPDYIGVAFDVKGPTFRHEKFAAYKAERPPMPDALSQQIPYIKKVVAGYGIAVFESQSFEADDIIATIAKKSVDAGL